METYSTMVRFFQEGGAFMYPILLVFALGAAIAIERYLFLSRAKTGNSQLWAKLHPLIQAGKLQEAASLTATSQTALARVLAPGLQRARNGHKAEEIESLLEEGLMEAIPRFERRTHYLATFANIATLLGLLGTIVGLIQAFIAVSQADPAEKADLLSSSISVAMNTTAFGLIVAIPLLLIFTILQTKTNEIVDGLEVASLKFLNLIVARNGHG